MLLSFSNIINIVERNGFSQVCAGCHCGGGVCKLRLPHSATRTFPTLRIALHHGFSQSIARNFLSLMHQENRLLAYIPNIFICCLHKWKEQPWRRMSIKFSYRSFLHASNFQAKGKTSGSENIGTHIRVLHFLPITVYFPKIRVIHIPIMHCLPESLSSF